MSYRHRHKKYFPVSTRRYFGVGTTLFVRQQRCYDVETTSCAYILGCNILEHLANGDKMKYRIKTTHVFFIRIPAKALEYQKFLRFSSRF